jgi:hypothetical protein
MMDHNFELTDNFTSRIVPFKSFDHAGKGICREAFGVFASRLNSVQLNLPEFFYAAQHYPIVFVKNQSGILQPCALTGLETGYNLFVDHQGNWHSQTYIPAFIRRFPFYTSITNDSDNSAQQVVLVEEAGLIDSEEPYFNHAGDATEKWIEVRAFLEDFISTEQQTNVFSENIEKLGLLEAFDAQINPQDSNNSRITGMFRIDENKLNSLPPKVIKNLMRKGELSRIYAHLMSLENFAKLLDMSVARQQLKNTEN